MLIPSSSPPYPSFLPTSTTLAIYISLPSLVCLLFFLYIRFLYVDFPAIQGIPEVPLPSRTSPLALLHGHLPLLGADHATTAETWARQHGWPVFQLRLGYRRVVFLNSFASAREWLVTRASCTIDRPLLYTFHGVVSKTSASTIGSNPWNEQTRKQRRVVGSLTTAPAIKRLGPMLDLETSQMVRSIWEAGEGGEEAIAPHIFQKRLALNIVLMFCYGRRFEEITDPLLLGILSDAKVISSFRSTNSNVQDYVPYMRMGIFQDKKRTAMAGEVRGRRDKWLATLLEEVKESIAAEKVKHCVASGLLTDTAENLSRQDVRTILGGLMSGGFETVFTTAIAGIAYLSSPQGQLVQEKAFQDILEGYGSVEAAFEQAVTGEKSPYVAALVRETLRYYPPLHILPFRQTYQDFDHNGARIPKGVMVLVNVQAVNHDPATYGPDAHVFRPERWIDPSLANKVPAPYHFSYGAGSRMCTAVNFSNRILYAVFLRLIVSFRIRQSDTAPPHLHYVDYNADTTAQSACPKEFKAHFELRDRDLFDRCLAQSETNTRDVTNGMVK